MDDLNDLLRVDRVHFERVVVQEGKGVGRVDGCAVAS